MKMVSEFIKELEELKEKYGDLPVVMSSGSDSFCENIDKWPEAEFSENGIWRSTDEEYKDCIVIL